MKKKFRIKHWYNPLTEKEVYTIQMFRQRFFRCGEWIDVKSISDEDPDYAKDCVEEVLYYLEREE